jgi:DNA-binding beta-propeller fold protein YncE
MRMAENRLVVALGSRRYRVERPWGDLPDGRGRVTDVTVDSRGHVFALLRYDPLVDEPGTPVIELDRDGARVAAWGGDLIADSHMLACSRDDRLYVVDRDAHEIVICSRDGRRLGGIGARHRPLEPFNHPTDIAFAPDGQVFVSDGYAGTKVHRFDSDGRAIASWGELGDGPGEFLNPHAVWILNDGRVVVVDRENDRLQVFTSDGKFLEAWTGFKQPLDIWGDAQGNLFVTDLVPSLTMLTTYGKLVGRCRPVLNGAHGVWGDHDGNIFLAEPNPSRLTRLAPI